MKTDNQDTSNNKAFKKGMAIQEAYERIKHLISVNQLVPGQKLIYGNLAKKLNMGVTPVIQALNRLEASGIVSYEANKGYFVGEITEAEVRQLYQAREALEIFIVPLIIENITPNDVKKIRQQFVQRKDARMSRREMILEDIRFHLAIARYARNDVIYNLLENIFEQVYLKYRPEYFEDYRIKEILSEHSKLLKHLINGDANESIALITHHSRTGLDYLLKTIQTERSGF